MLIVGLTGGIGTGKSVVTRIFRRNGIETIDADEIAREVIRPGTRAYSKLRAVFDAHFFDEHSGEVKREELAQLIFHDAESRRRLNEIVHPEVRKQVVKRIIVSFLKLNKLVVLDIPLFFEAGLDKWISTSIVVWCNEFHEVRRLAARDNLTIEEARARIATQMAIGDKMHRATHLVDNNGSIEETERQVEELIGTLRRSWQPLIVRTLTVLSLAVLSWVVIKSLQAGASDH